MSIAMLGFIVTALWVQSASPRSIAGRVVDATPEPRYSTRARLVGFLTVTRKDVVPSARSLTIVLSPAPLAIVDRVGHGPSGPPPSKPSAVPAKKGDCSESSMNDKQSVRIVAMGDSTTAGTPAFKSPREAPPNGSGDKTSQYAYWLMKAHPDWDVINQGINAQRSDQIAARFDDDVIGKKPAVVVIIAGVNDVYQGRPAQQVKDQLAAMYIRAHD